MWIYGSVQSAHISISHCPRTKKISGRKTVEKKDYNNTPNKKENNKLRITEMHLLFHWKNKTEV